MANPIESLLVSFGKKELTRHPEILANLIVHVLEERGVTDTTILADVNDLVKQAVPLIMAKT